MIPQKLDECPECGEDRTFAWSYDAQYCSSCGYNALERPAAKPETIEGDWADLMAAIIMKDITAWTGNAEAIAPACHALVAERLRTLYAEAQNQALKAVLGVMRPPGQEETNGDKHGTDADEKPDG